MNLFFPSTTIGILNGSELPDDTLVFSFRSREILLSGERLPRLADFPQKETLSGIHVGDLNGKPCIGISFPEEGEWETKPLRAVIHETDEPTVCAICRAKELMFWRDRRAYCGVCGTKMEDSPEDLARICPSCGERFYPQIAPAVITAVLNHGKILLAHNRNFSGNVFSLIAGFVESGETLEQAVAREIMEETAIRVKNIRYYGSQPWPFPNSLMLGFVADYDSGELQPDGIELEKAGWFSPEELPQLPDHGSIARRIIEDFRHNIL